eukprot:1790770-Pleurochrysis_carterae.AAC.3
MPGPRLALEAQVRGALRMPRRSICCFAQSSRALANIAGARGFLRVDWCGDGARARAGHRLVGMHRQVQVRRAAREQAEIDRIAHESRMITDGNAVATRHLIDSETTAVQKQTISTVNNSVQPNC